MTKRPGKIIQASTVDLFDLQPSLKERIIEQLKKDKRTTIPIIQKKLKVNEPTTRKTILRLVDEGIVKDLGIHNINGFNSRVFELV